MQETGKEREELEVGGTGSGAHLGAALFGQMLKIAVFRLAGCTTDSPPCIRCHSRSRMHFREPGVRLVPQHLEESAALAVTQTSEKRVCLCTSPANVPLYVSDRCALWTTWLPTSCLCVLL